jgi:long-chain acyl-CoA synthetase
MAIHEDQATKEHGLCALNYAKKLSGLTTRTGRRHVCLRPRDVYPGEVEKLLERHPDIAQAIVVAARDDIKGQIPVAFIVPQSGRHPTVAEIKRYSLAEGPAYAHPRFAEFLPSLPVSGTHKFDRTASTAEAERIVKAAGRSH